MGNDPGDRVRESHFPKSLERWLRLSGWLAFGPPPLLPLEDYNDLLGMAVALERVVPTDRWIEQEVSAEEMFGG